MNEKLNGHHIFGGRSLVIATMHQKESVVAPLLEEELGVKCFTIPTLNTDVFGTFSGEINRNNSPLQTAKLKAFAAIALCDATLAIASEGSFGAHPASLFATANEELVVLIDTKNQLEIVGRHLTFKTNSSRQEVNNLSDFEEFKIAIGYPAHGVILKIQHDITNEKVIHKDFASPKELNEIVSSALEKNHKVEVETDMRAMHNPTRMKAIEQAVLDLVKNCNSFCPQCNTAGFTIQSVISGLPCELCLVPTKSTKAYRYQCQKCDFIEEQLKDGSGFEDPTFCDYCNP